MYMPLRFPIWATLGHSTVYFVLAYNGKQSGIAQYLSTMNKDHKKMEKLEQGIGA